MQRASSAPARWLIKLVSPGNDYQGVTPLLAAVSLGHEGVVSALIAGGADPSTPEVHGPTAAELAKESGSEAIKQLLRAPASPAHRDRGCWAEQGLNGSVVAQAGRAKLDRGLELSRPAHGVGQQLC